MSNVNVFSDLVQEEFIQSLSNNANNKLPNQPPSSQIDLANKDSNSLKQILRKGPLPLYSPLRRHLWQQVLSVRCRSNYDDLLRAKGSLAVGHSRHICSFLHSALVKNFHLTEQGVDGLYRVLDAIEREMPSLSFAPYIYPLTALLLHYVSEMEALSAVRLILAKDNFLPTSQSAWKQWTLCVEALLRRHSKSVTLAVTQSNNCWHNIYDWPILLWRLPMEHLVRLVDCLFLEGEKVLLRAVVVLFRVFFKQRPKSAPSGDYQQLWEEMEVFFSQCDRHLSSQELLDRMFRINSFSRARIQAAKEKANSMPEFESFFSTLKHHCSTAIVKHLAFSSTRHANPSEMLTFEEILTIMEQLPNHIASLMKPVRLFSTNVDGTSIKTLLERLDGHGFSLMVIYTTERDVFGAFCGDSWAGRHSAQHLYFGRGMTFVFTVRPKGAFYYWVNKTEERLMNLFMKADAHGLYVGGGSEGAAIYLNESLARGSSYFSPTFNNPSLVSSNTRQFQVALVEIFGFVEA